MNLTYMCRHISLFLGVHDGLCPPTWRRLPVARAALRGAGLALLLLERAAGTARCTVRRLLHSRLRVGLLVWPPRRAPVPGWLRDWVPLRQGHLRGPRDGGPTARA